MNLGRETKNAVSSRRQNRGSENSNRSLPIKHGTKNDNTKPNKTKANMKTEKNFEKSSNNKSINKLVNFVTSPYTRNRKTCQQANKVSDESSRKQKNDSCKTSLSCTDTIQKSDI